MHPDDVCRTARSGDTMVFSLTIGNYNTPWFIPTLAMTFQQRAPAVGYLFIYTPGSQDLQTAGNYYFRMLVPAGINSGTYYPTNFQMGQINQNGTLVKGSIAVSPAVQQLYPHYCVNIVSPYPAHAPSGLETVVGLN